MGAEGLFCGWLHARVEELETFFTGSFLRNHDKVKVEEPSLLQKIYRLWLSSILGSVLSEANNTLSNPSCFFHVKTF